MSIASQLEASDTIRYTLTFANMSRLKQAVQVGEFRCVCRMQLMCAESHAEHWRKAKYKCPACGKAVSYCNWPKHWYAHRAKEDIPDGMKGASYNVGVICRGRNGNCKHVCVCCKNWVRHLDSGCDGVPGMIDGQQALPKWVWRSSMKKKKNHVGV